MGSMVAQIGRYMALPACGHVRELEAQGWGEIPRPAEVLLALFPRPVQSRPATEMDQAPHAACNM